MKRVRKTTVWLKSLLVSACSGRPVGNVRKVYGL